MTRRLLKLAGVGLSAVMVLLLFATLVLYGLSARILNKTYVLPAEAAVVVPSGPAALAEGKRLVAIRGCAGCHGPNLEGDVMVDDPMLARIASPNLSRLLPTYSDAELERLLRHGVRKDGRGVVIMPASMFAPLSDADLGVMIGYLRTIPPVDRDWFPRVVGPLGRLGLASGKFHLESDVIDQAAAHAATAPAGDRLALGRYLARTSCTECHGLDLKGQQGGGPPGPNLAVAVAYSDSAFRYFFRTGNALGNRRLALMSVMTQERFSHFTDDEVGALLAYLKTLQ